MSSKLSDLPSAGALLGGDLLYVARSGVSYQTSLDDIQSAIGGQFNGVVQTYADLPIDGSAAIGEIWLVRESSGTWLINRKQRGLYQCIDDTGVRAADWQYLGEWLEEFSDANFALYNAADNTKGMNFSLSGITPGQTRTLTVPDVSGTILTTGAVVTAPQGGTGQTSYTTGDFLYASSSSALSKRAIGSTNAFLTVSGGLPAWSSATLSLGGNVATGGALTFSGAFGTTITVTGTTTVTLPTSGTLAALGGTNAWTGVNTFSNTTDASSALTGAVIISGGLGVAKNAFFTGQLSQSYNGGSLAAGVVRGFNQLATGTGDAGGTTNLRALENQVATTGANSFAGTYALVGANLTGGSAGTVTTAVSIWGYGAVTAAQAVGTYNGVLLSGAHSGAGNVTSAWNGVNISGWSFSSTGDLTGTITGVVITDIGRAAATVNTGVDVLSLTKGSGNAYGIRSRMASGSGKWSGYFDGTADFYVAGKTGIGIAAATTAQLALAAGTTGVASLNIPHGAAPSSPVNGDIWTTTAGIFIRINGATVGPLS